MGNKNSVIQSDKRRLLTEGYVRSLWTENDLNAYIMPKILTDIVFQYLYEGINKWLNNVVSDQDINTPFKEKQDKDKNNKSTFKIIHELTPYILFESSESVGLIFSYPKLNTGIWKFQMKVVKRRWAMSIGIIQETADDDDDNDNKERKYYSYYHGGGSVNMINNGERMYMEPRFNEIAKWFNVGVEIDMDKRRLSPIYDGKVNIKSGINIPAGTYLFNIWLGNGGGQIKVFPPQNMTKSYHDDEEIKKSVLSMIK